MEKRKGEKIKEIVVEHDNKSVTWEVYKELCEGVETVTLYKKTVYSKSKKERIGSLKKSNS